MSDYLNTSSPYHSKHKTGGKGSANNLGLRKYEATTEYSFDNTPSEDEEFDRYGAILCFMPAYLAEQYALASADPKFIFNFSSCPATSFNGFNTFMNGKRSKRRYDGLLLGRFSIL